MQTNKRTDTQTKKPRSRPTKKPANDRKTQHVSGDFHQFLKEHKEPGRTEKQFADELMEYWKAGHGESVMDVPTFQKIMNEFKEEVTQIRRMFECLFYRVVDVEDQVPYLVTELKAHRRDLLTKLNGLNDPGEENAITAVWDTGAKANTDTKALLEWFRDQQNTVTADLYFEHKIYLPARKKSGGLSKLCVHIINEEQDKYRNRLKAAAAAGEEEAETNRINAELDRKAVRKQFSEEMYLYSHTQYKGLIVAKEIDEIINNLDITFTTAKDMKKEIDKTKTEIDRKAIKKAEGHKESIIKEVIRDIIEWNIDCRLKSRYNKGLPPANRKALEAAIREYDPDHPKKTATEFDIIFIELERQNRLEELFDENRNVILDEYRRKTTSKGA